jgi:histidinol phosphatase-like PHP family hydrolase
MQTIIDALKRRNLAVEINDTAHTPHDEFIFMAKEHELKFTFGSDSRNQQAGRLDYCKYTAKKCKLKRNDFFIPKRALNRAYPHEVAFSSLIGRMRKSISVPVLNPIA